MHIFTSRENFFVITKISYLQPFREIMGGPEKALHQRRTNERTNDERRTTNDERTNERRTTWTMIIARQDSFRILGLITAPFYLTSPTICYAEGEYVFSRHQFFASLDICMYLVRIGYQLKCTNRGPVLSSCLFSSQYIFQLFFLYFYNFIVGAM